MQFINNQAKWEQTYITVSLSNINGKKVITEGMVNLMEHFGKTLKNCKNLNFAAERNFTIQSCILTKDKTLEIQKLQIDFII